MLNNEASSRDKRRTAYYRIPRRFPQIRNFSRCEQSLKYSAGSSNHGQMQLAGAKTSRFLPYRVNAATRSSVVSRERESDRRKKSEKKGREKRKESGESRLIALSAFRVIERRVYFRRSCSLFLSRRNFVINLYVVERIGEG